MRKASHKMLPSAGADPHPFDRQRTRQRDQAAAQRAAVQRANRLVEKAATRLGVTPAEILLAIRFGYVWSDIELMSAASFATACAGRKLYPTSRDGIGFLRAARNVFSSDQSPEGHQQFQIMNRISQRGTGNAGLSRDAKRRLNAAVDRIAA